MEQMQSNLYSRVNYLHKNEATLMSQWRTRATVEIAAQRQIGWDLQLMTRLICVAHYSVSVLGEELWNFEEAYVCLLTQTFLHGERQIAEIVKGFGDDANMRLFRVRYPGFERETIVDVLEPHSLVPGTVGTFGFAV